MRILFLTHYFPPEVNAPARRTYEHAIEWAKQGADVTILTNHPNHPDGKLFPGYRNHWLTIEKKDAVTVKRMKTYLTPNKGFFKRSLNYSLFCLLSVWHSIWESRPDVVIATSPQFFAGISGALVSHLRNVPFILEIRDLWPDSISTVGAASSPRLLRLLSVMETWLYNQAHHIVVNSEAFVPHIQSRLKKEIPISFVPNGIHMGQWAEKVRAGSDFAPEKLTDISKIHVGYIGTLGMAHGLQTVLDAAKLLENDGVTFHLVGSGSEKETLEKHIQSAHISNVVLHGLVDHDHIPLLLSQIDIILVSLRNQALFETVIPSKIYEAMVAGKPMVAAVQGQAKKLIEAHQVGLCVAPENAAQIASAIRILMHSPENRAQMGANGTRAVKQHYSRERLAQDFLSIIQNISIRNRLSPQPMALHR